MSLLTWGGETLTWGGTPLTWGPYTPPSPDPIPAQGLAPAVEWLWSVGPGASATTPGPTIDLVSAYGRVITWRSRGHAYAQFTIDGRTDEAAEIVPLISDVWAYRDSVLVFRGRVLTAAPQLDSDQHLWSVLAIDYRGMLSAAGAVEPPVPVFPSVDQGEIVWDLVEAWQARDGGDWGITNGAGATSGTLRDETDITPGAPIGQVVDRLGNRDGGFEWEVTADLVLNRYYPVRTRDLSVVLDWGDNVIATEGVPAEFANVAVATGGEGTEPVVSAPDLTADERGRWTRTESFPSVTVQSTLTAKAAFVRASLTRKLDTWTATLSPGEWGGPDRLWIGDLVRFEVNDGALAISGPHRAVELQAVCGDHGTETVRVELEPWP